MKKIMTGLLIMVFVLGMGTFAYAGTNAGNTTTDRKALLVQNMKALKEQIQPQIAQIKANRTEIQKLRIEAREAYKVAMQNIKDLKGKSDQLTEAQIAALKTTKESLKTTKLALSNTKGDVRTEMLAIRDARKDQNIGQAKAALENIITIQQNRIALIKTGIDEMNRILEI